jgi:hypothetical protein
MCSELNLNCETVAVFALIFSPTCPKAKYRNFFYLFKTNSFIIFTGPNPVLLVPGFSFTCPRLQFYLSQASVLLVPGFSFTCPGLQFYLSQACFTCPRFQFYFSQASVLLVPGFSFTCPGLQFYLSPAPVLFCPGLQNPALLVPGFEQVS